MKPVTIAGFSLVFHDALTRVVAGAQCALVGTGHATREAAEKEQRSFRAFARLVEGSRGTPESAWLVRHKAIAHVMHGSVPGTWDVSVRAVPRLDSAIASALEEAIARINASSPPDRLTR
jgi:hypothetical protein